MSRRWRSTGSARVAFVMRVAADRQTSAPLFAHQHSQDVVNKIRGDLPKLVGGAVLNGMWRPDYPRPKTERTRLRCSGILEFRRYDKATRDATIIQILDVMQTARRAGSSIR